MEEIKPDNCEHPSVAPKLKLITFSHGNHELCYIHPYVRCRDCSYGWIREYQMEEGRQNKKNAICKFEAGLKKYRKSIYELDT